MNLILNTLLMVFLSYAPLSDQTQQNSKSFWKVRVSSLPKTGDVTNILPLDNNRVCLSFANPNCLVIINALTLRQENRVLLPAEPMLLSIDQDRNEIFMVSANRPILTIVDASSLKILSSIGLPRQMSPTEIALDESHNLAYIGDEREPVIYVVDLQKRLVTTHIHLSGPALKLALSRSKRRLYVATQIPLPKPPKVVTTATATLDVINLTSQQRINTISLPMDRVARLCLLETKHLLYVLSKEKSLIVALTLDEEDRLPIARGPKVIPDNWGSEDGWGVDLAYDAGSDILYDLSAGLNTHWFCAISQKTLTVKQKISADGAIVVLQPRQGHRSSRVYILGTRNLIIIEPKQVQERK